MPPTDTPEISENVYSMSGPGARTSTKQEVGPVCLEDQWGKSLKQLEWPEKSIHMYQYF